MKTTLPCMDGQLNVTSLLSEKRMACCTFVTKLASVMLISLWSQQSLSQPFKSLKHDIADQMGPEKTTNLIAVNTSG